MTKIRPTVLMSAVSGNKPMNAYGAEVLVIARAPAWSKKPIVLKNGNIAAEQPSIAQIERRLALAEAARAAARATEGLHGAARVIAMNDYVRSQLAGEKSPHSMRPEMYPSRIKKTFHTEEQLRSLLERKAGIEVAPRYY